MIMEYQGCDGLILASFPRSAESYARRSIRRETPIPHGCVQSLSHMNSARPVPLGRSVIRFPETCPYSTRAVDPNGKILVGEMLCSDCAPGLATKGTNVVTTVSNTDARSMLQKRFKLDANETSEISSSGPNRTHFRLGSMFRVAPWLQVEENKIRQELEARS